MKWNFLYQITAASRLGGYRSQIPILSVLCPQLNLLNPPPKKKILGKPLGNKIYGSNIWKIQFMSLEKQ